MSQEVTIKGKKYAREAIQKWVPEFESLLQGVDARYFTGVAIAAIQNNPKLLECSEVSWFNSLRFAAQLSLTIDGSLGQAYLVPYAKQATLIIGYKGLRELVYRTGLFYDIQAEVVHKNDDFRIKLGLDQELHHIPTDGEPGKPIGCYVIASRIDGNRVFGFMWEHEILRIRDRYSQAYKNAEKSWKGNPATKDSMWHTDPEMAYKKTVLHRMCGNRLQISVVAQRVINRENKMDAGLDISKDDDFIEIEPDLPDDIPTPGEEEQTPDKTEKGVGGMVDAIKKGNGSKKAEGQSKEPKEPEETSSSVDLRIVIREALEKMYPKIPFGSQHFNQKIDEVCTAVLGSRDAPYLWKMLNTEELVKIWDEINNFKST